MKNILMIGAHFDDVELGCGGTAAKLVAEGKTVYKLTLTDNVTNYTDKNIFVAYETSIEASAKACKILGVKEIPFPVQKCNGLIYSTELMQKLEKIIADYQIDTVFIHFSDDLNQDHIEASKISKTASRYCDNVLAYQSNTYILSSSYYPSYFFDISNFIELKKNALAQYGKEHDRFGELFSSNISRNKVWGYGNHVDYAEGFVVIKMLEK